LKGSGGVKFRKLLRSFFDITFEINKMRSNLAFPPLSYTHKNYTKEIKKEKNPKIFYISNNSCKKTCLYYQK